MCLGLAPPIPPTPPTGLLLPRLPTFPWLSVTLPPPSPSLLAHPQPSYIFSIKRRVVARGHLCFFSFFSLRERRRETNDGSVNKRSIRIFISILLRKIAHLSLSRVSISSKLNHGYPQRLLGQSHRRSSFPSPRRWHDD